MEQITDIERSILIKNTDIYLRTYESKATFMLNNIKVNDSEKYMKKNLIAFEGIDGAGKSTIIEMLKNSDIKDKLSFSCDPQRKNIGKYAREYISQNPGILPVTISKLFAADRTEHLTEIDKNISEGKLHITDRYIMSSFAYQGLNGVLANIDIPRAEYTFYFDIPVDVALKRIKISEREQKLEDEGLANRFEHKEQLTQVKNNFNVLIKIGLFNTIYFDATKPAEKIFADVLATLMVILKEKK